MMQAHASHQGFMPQGSLCTQWHHETDSTPFHCQQWCLQINKQLLSHQQSHCCQHQNYFHTPREIIPCHVLRPHLLQQAQRKIISFLWHIICLLVNTRLVDIELSLEFIVDFLESSNPSRAHIKRLFSSRILNGSQGNWEITVLPPRSQHFDYTLPVPAPQAPLNHKHIIL